jgi:hypothetical protein
VEIKSSFDATPLMPMDIMEDNQAAIAWSSNPVLSQRMRHVERGLLHVRQMVLEKKIRLVWIETANQLADMFTKAPVFLRFVRMVMISAAVYRAVNELEEDQV